ncbi:hypothetical protein [Elongatibacter sediminis]|uniref:Uncharacterized protein n=1 Tax=Elongatibacter sediminis TaxID=3119006 RepID=A0AAW9RC04_9GAMM
MPLLVTAIAAMVLVLSGPRVVASIRYLPIEHALDEYYRTLEIPTDRLPVLMQFAQTAIAYNDHPRYFDGLSVLHYLRGLDVYTPARQRIGEYRAAEGAALESLSRSPAQPAAWLRVSYIRWVLRDEAPDVIRPWKMSIFAGRMESALFLQRVEIGMAYRTELDEEGSAMLRDQILLAWELRPGSLIQLLARRDPSLAQTRALIGTADPLALAEMEAWVEKAR